MECQTELQTAASPGVEDDRNFLLQYLILLECIDFCNFCGTGTSQIEVFDEVFTSVDFPVVVKVHRQLQQMLRQFMFRVAPSSMRK